MPDGSVAYTRDGAFQVDAQGQLVTNNGFTVQPGITIPANAQSTAAGTRTAQGEFALKRLQFRLGEKQWADTDTVADEVRVRYRFVFPQ